MHIQLDEKTKSYIQSKGKPISVKLLQINSCCAPSIEEVTIHFGKPKDVYNYIELKMDDLSIFVEKQISHNKEMTLKLFGLGVFKTVIADISVS